jgi:hypothetical protein
MKIGPLILRRIVDGIGREAKSLVEAIELGSILIPILHSVRRAQSPSEYDESFGDRLYEVTTSVV